MEDALPPLPKGRGFRAGNRMKEVTRQGVRNLDLIKRKIEIVPCQSEDGKHVGGTLSKWRTKGMMEVRECLCCHRVMEERET